MKRIVLALVAFSALVLFAWGNVAQATNMKTGDTVTVARNETVDASFYGAGNTVSVAGTVQGDVYCAGQNITVSGVVEGDVICAGQEVRITGTVLGDVRAAGQTVSITGKVNGNLTAMGQTISLENSGSIGGDITATGQSIFLGGKAGRDVVAAGETVSLASMVNRNAVVTAQTTHLQSGSQVVGNLTYTSNNKVMVDNGAKVVGTTTHKQPPHAMKREQTDLSTRLTMGLYWFIALFISGLVFWLLLPKWLQSTTKFMEQKALASFGLGFGSLVLTPIAAILLCITIIGIPLGFALGTLWMFALFASFVVTAHTFGTWALNALGKKGKLQEILGLLVGSFAVVFFSMLPLIGGIFGLAALLWGLGGIAFGVYTTLRRQQVRRVKA